MQHHLPVVSRFTSFPHPSEPLKTLTHRALSRPMPGPPSPTLTIPPSYLRYILTPIVSPHVQTILENAGVAFADKADAGKAALHFSSDPSIHGRALAILPREQVPEGYTDLCVDDFNEGETMTPFQTGGTALRARAKAGGA